MGVSMPSVGTDVKLATVVYRVVHFGVQKQLQARTADSSSKNAVSISSARTTNRFPSPRCASAIEIVRPSQSNADTQPQLQPALLRLSAIISQCFTGSAALLI